MADQLSKFTLPTDPVNGLDAATKQYVDAHVSPAVPGGSSTQLQFNDGGAFAGATGLVWNKTTGQFGVTGPFGVTGNATVTGTLSVSSSVTIGGTFALTSGTLAAGRVLTSDASGNGTWQVPPGATIATGATPPTTPTTGDLWADGTAITAMAQKNNAITITDPTNESIATVTINDDLSNTTSWPDRWQYRFGGQRTGSFNEYGELRADAAKDNTVPMRVAGHSLTHSQNLFEVVIVRSGALRFNVDAAGNIVAVGTATAATPTASTHLTTKGYVDGRTPKVTVGLTAPTVGVATNDVWIDTN